MSISADLLLVALMFVAMSLTAASVAMIVNVIFAYSLLESEAVGEGMVT